MNGLSICALLSWTQISARPATSSTNLYSNSTIRSPWCSCRFRTPIVRKEQRSKKCHSLRNCWECWRIEMMKRSLIQMASTSITLSLHHDVSALTKTSTDLIMTTFLKQCSLWSMRKRLIPWSSLCSAVYTSLVTPTIIAIGRTDDIWASCRSVTTNIWTASWSILIVIWESTSLQPWLELTVSPNTTRVPGSTLPTAITFTTWTYIKRSSQSERSSPSSSLGLRFCAAL